MDGTTDVTRTFHYGNPSDFEKEVYTRVLMGSIDLARATFIDGTPDTRLDILARWHLFQVGLNYRHGTGHGIGNVDLSSILYTRWRFKIMRFRCIRLHP